MAQKVGTSVVLTLEQMNWAEKQDGSISEVVRDAMDHYIDEQE